MDQVSHTKDRNIVFGVEAHLNEAKDAFVGFYRAPGITPGYVRLPNGKVAPFGTKDAAKVAATERLFEVLNAIRVKAAKHSKAERYERLSGPEFAELLQDSGITLTLFCYLYGTSMKRALQWIDGRNEKGEEELAPHPARVMLEIFKRSHTAVDVAQKITDSVATKR